MRQFFILCGFLLASLFGPSAFSEEDKVTLVGLTLGVTVDEAFAVVEASGYEPYLGNKRDHRSYGPSYQQIFDFTKAGRHYSSIRLRDHSTVSAADFSHSTNAEGITLWFTPFKDGPRLSSIGYANRTPNLLQEEFGRKLIERYGDPTETNRHFGSFQWRWYFAPITGTNGIARPEPLSETLEFKGTIDAVPRKEHSLLLKGGPQLSDVVKEINSIVQSSKTPADTTF